MLRHPAVGTVAVKLLYFGGRYASVLAVARLLGADATGYLFAVALSEAMRLICDFGLESHIIAGLHRKDQVPTGSFRLFGTVVGQIICSFTAVLVALHREQSVPVAFAGSLHFALLMAFGYRQARLQADHSLSRLARPMVIAVVAQALMLVGAYQHAVPAIWCCISFEFISMLLCARVGRNSLSASGETDDTPVQCARATYRQLRPLGHTAVLSFLYSRLDIWALSAVASSTAMTQYLATQRIASAPLMLLATVAGAMVPSLAAQAPNAEATVLRTRFLKAGGLGALMTLVFVSLAGLYAAPWLVREAAPQPNLGLIALQACIAATQVANSFFSAALLADGQAARLFTMAWRGALTAIFSFSLAIWVRLPEAIAAAVLATELVIVGQHLVYRLAMSGKKGRK